MSDYSLNSYYSRFPAATACDTSLRFFTTSDDKNAITATTATTIIIITPILPPVVYLNRLVTFMQFISVINQHSQPL